MTQLFVRSILDLNFCSKVDYKALERDICNIVCSIKTHETR